MHRKTVLPLEKSLGFSRQDRRVQGNFPAPIMGDRKLENQTTTRGGKRPGAGRPKGALGAGGKVRRLIWNRPKDVSLIEFARSIIDDPNQSVEIRQRMAAEPCMRAAQKSRARQPRTAGQSDS
jgi:hypothetical protein